MIYKKIFEPFSIGKLHLKNRIVMGPMGTGFADENHAITPELVAYYEERAKGGAGFIICENTISQPVGMWGPRACEIYSEQSVTGWKKVVDAVHKHGAKIAIEIGHMGRSTNPENTNGLTPVAPSAVPCHKRQYIPHEITLEEIEQFKKDYVHSVNNAYKAGFDAVQLHFTNGYFLAQWLSGRANKRTDRYGGTLEGRLLLPLEIIAMIKKEIGSDFPLFARLASREINSGRDIEETKVIALALQEAGLVMLEINTGSFSDFDWEFPPYYQPPGFNLNDVDEIRKSLKIPVITGGRITEPRMAEQILLEGRAELVAISRGLLADPYWVEKTAENEIAGIRRCIGCTRCIDELRPDRLKCSVNPFVGKEGAWEIEAAKKIKNVLVVGGGPAGLQAAIILSQRGHHVTLVEKEKQLGGMVRAAAVPPMKWETAGLITTLAYQAEKQGVRIVLGQEADVEYIKQANPDEVILATGATPLIPNLPGIKSPYVYSAVDILLGKSWVGNNVAIIGGGMIGCETADFLAEYNKDITIFEMLDKIGSDVWSAVKIGLFKRLKANEVKMYTSVKVTKIEEGVLTYLKDNQEYRSEKFDNVIIAVGMKASLPLKDALTDAGIKATVLGDAENPSRLHEVLTSAVEKAILL